MAILSAFADEIDADPKVQMDVLDKHGIKHIELRAAWNTNIMKLTDAQVKQLRALREETMKNRQADMAARMELRSKLMAGEITRQEFRTQRTERINAMETRREQRGDPARALLNDTQRERLQSLQQEMRQQRAAQGRADFRARGWMGMQGGSMNMQRGRMDMRRGAWGGGWARPARPPEQPAPPAPPDSN